MPSPCVNCGANVKVCKECDWYNGLWIRKDQYKTHLKSDMVAMLKEIQDEIFKESWRLECICDDLDGSAVDLDDINKIIQQKINKIKGED